MTGSLPYRGLTIEEVIARICAGEPVTWLTRTNNDGTYEVAVEFSSRRDKQNNPQRPTGS
jgi:hypothetical protein